MIKDAKTKQGYTISQRQYLRLFRMQFKLKTFMKEGGYLFFPPFKLSSVTMEYNEIIHITEIVFRLQRVLHKLVQVV